jgi:hypothetical protein
MLQPQLTLGPAPAQNFASDPIVESDMTPNPPEDQSRSYFQRVFLDKAIWQQVIGSLIVAGIVATIGFIAHDLAHSNKTTTSTTRGTTGGSRTDATAGFQAFTLEQPKLTVRVAPSNAVSARGQLPFHTAVWIVCTRAGDLVTGAASITSTTWDKIRTGPSDPPLGFVPDAWVDTGTTGPTAPSC